MIYAILALFPLMTQAERYQISMLARDYLNTQLTIYDVNGVGIKYTYKDGSTRDNNNGGVIIKNAQGRVLYEWNYYRDSAALKIVKPKKITTKDTPALSAAEVKNTKGDKK